MALIFFLQVGHRPEARMAAEKVGEGEIGVGEILLGLLAEQITGEV